MTVCKRSFALFGPRAAGKTVFLVAFYGSSQNTKAEGQSYLVTAADNVEERENGRK